MSTLFSVLFAYVGCACGFYAYILFAAEPMPEEMEVREAELPAPGHVPTFTHFHAA